MGLAVDTIVFSAVNPGAAPAADNAVPNAGDAKGVRNFNPASRARLDFIARQGATAGFISIKSPRFHDVSRGLQLIFNESPSTRLLPPEVGQPVYGADVMQVTLSGGAAETDGAAAGIYYYDIGGISAQLKSPGDIYPAIVNIKPIEVDVPQPAGAFAWADTLLTTTENLLKANTFYAILGYDTDTAAIAVGVRGPSTGNLRVCGPGPTTTFFTNDYFVVMSERHNAPYIPIFNANDRNNFFLSTSQLATGGTTKVMLLAAELASSFQP